LQEELERATDAVDWRRYKRTIIGQLREGKPLDPTFATLAATIENISDRAAL